ncbi:hypothetical protein [Sphingomonas sp.]|uniref:hypothetical protein n=1 Tax=Sphingomonas sp. TaxID=28214 RepID=UPI001DC3BB7F|nr:hypothetical protein [Sphingomonas sp.]MBX9796802.1 hypothetical protein [Sphingomonas sp.]
MTRRAFAPLLLAALLAGCGGARDAGKGANAEAAIENQAAAMEASVERSSNQTMHDMIGAGENSMVDPVPDNTTAPANSQ